MRWHLILKGHWFCESWHLRCWKSSASIAKAQLDAAVFSSRDNAFACPAILHQRAASSVCVLLSVLVQDRLRPGHWTRPQARRSSTSTPSGRPHCHTRATACSFDHVSAVRASTFVRSRPPVVARLYRWPRRCHSFAALSRA